jgi:2,3-bisphosphoglycerate-independent phosphoglycerate mutase
MSSQKAMLIILDGWGIGPDPKRSAIAQAKTPVFKGLLAKYPNAALLTHGEHVGLPERQMGNSEVGHINIGAGRVIYQELARINKAIREKELHTHPVLLEAIAAAKFRGKKIHLMGLVSDGGVHSHIDHLKALCDILEEQGVKESYIHAFTDGRDTDPKSGLGFINEVQDHIKGTHVYLATLIGRYYAMDRDNRWERTQLAYDLMVHGKGERTNDISKWISNAYAEGITDEFLKGVVTDPGGLIEDEDLIIFFNFRTDRPRQITRVLTQSSVPGYDMTPLNLDMVTFTRYDEEFFGLDVVFEKDSVENGLGETISKYGLKQLRIAETEKYPHVTFFFSGGREEAYRGEGRVLVPSPKVATYDLQPEMSAQGITDGLLDYVRKEAPDFVCLNFANTDMVGHTGVFEAAIKAAETVDHCLGQILDNCLPLGYNFVIIADHGNSDYMINDDGSPNTAHTTNPVPVIIAGNNITKANTVVKDGKLADVAPTVLALLGLNQPAEMTGHSLIAK